MNAIAQQEVPTPFDKVTEEHINSRIVSVEYFVLPNSTVTICNITLVNGFSIRGESACVDPRAFDAEKGRKYSYERAYSKLWELEGFLLAETRYKWGQVVEAASVV